jgi:hypothetical protein
VMWLSLTAATESACACTSSCHLRRSRVRRFPIQWMGLRRTGRTRRASSDTGTFVSAVGSRIEWAADGLTTADRP